MTPKASRPPGIKWNIRYEWDDVPFDEEKEIRFIVDLDAARKYWREVGHGNWDYLVEWPFETDACLVSNDIRPTVFIYSPE